MQLNYAFLILLLCFMHPNIEAQKQKRVLFGHKPSLNIKFSPLNMLEAYYHTLEGAIEYKFHPKYSLQFQFGYGNSDITFHNRLYREIDEAEFETFRSRIEFRKYTNLKYINNLWSLRSGKAHFTYWAVELMWRNTIFYDNNLVGQNCRSGFCDYQEVAFFRRVKNIGVVNFKLGNQQFWGKHLFIDYYLGAGLRFIDVAAPDEDPNAFMETRQLVDPREPKKLILPGFALGIKLGYSINLKK